jgi:hypothetical protein
MPWSLKEAAGASHGLRSGPPAFAMPTGPPSPGTGETAGTPTAVTLTNRASLRRHTVVTGPRSAPRRRVRPSACLDGPGTRVGQDHCVRPVVAERQEGFAHCVRSLHQPAVGVQRTARLCDHVLRRMCLRSRPRAARPWSTRLRSLALVMWPSTGPASRDGDVPVVTASRFRLVLASTHVSAPACAVGEPGEWDRSPSHACMRVRAKVARVHLWARRQL